MILVATLNLYVHKTAIVDGLEINGLNHIQDHRLMVGESAIYSALVIKILQGEPYVLGLAGGIGGRFIKNFMDKNRIKSDLLWKEYETRSELKIIDSVNMTETIFMDDNFSFNDIDAKHLKHKFLSNLKDVDTVVINNKPLTSCSSTKVIEDLMLISKENNQKLILSLEGIELRKALDYNPYGIVIDDSDLKELDIEDIEDEKPLLDSLRKLVTEKKIRYLVYDHHKNKNLFVISKNKICCAKYGKFSKNMEEIGSKDIIAGALAMGVSRKYEMEKITKLIAAVKGSVKIEDYPNVFLRKNIDDLYNKIKLIEI